MLQTTLERNLLKYTAGRLIFCPKCQTVMDWRKTVIIERTSDHTHVGACCSGCFDAAVDGRDIDVEKYRVIRYSSAKKTIPKAESQHDLRYQQKGKALSRFLQSDIHKAHVRTGNCTKHDRLFPQGYGHGIKLNETTQDDGTISIWYSGDPQYSRHQIDTYVSEYCRLNHLKG